MMINPVSFGKKIPITNCQIQDRQNGKFVNATVYELDCKDKSDVEEIQALDNNWDFKDIIISGMRGKLLNGDFSCSKFYKMENDKGETLGLCYARNQSRNLSVHCFESKQNGKYKYVGQSFLASLALDAYNKGKNKLVVRSVMSHARDYYKEVCGFKDANACDVEIDRAGMIDLIDQTEKRTNGKIVDF